MKFLSLSALIFCLVQSNLLFAGTVTSCASKQGNNNSLKYDYGDAPQSYGVACHQTDAWQSLGGSKRKDSKWDKDAPNDVAIDSDNATDDGVKWRIKNEDGSWGKWGTSATLTQGEQVQFAFKFTRSSTGNHKYDALKSWVDWNGSGDWSNNSDEILIDETWAKNHDHKDKVDGGGTWNKDIKLTQNKDGVWGTENSDVLFRHYKQTITVPISDFEGDTWLRARVMCENSLTNYSQKTGTDTYNIAAFGFQDQGEVEDYRLKIVKKPTVEVSEPSTLLILLSGLFIAIRRRK